MNSFFKTLENHRDIGVLLLRLFIGIRLIYGVMDNVLSWDHMSKFRDFLQQFNFPLPIVSAVVSVYAQLIAGVMLALGFKTRWAAILMIINFLLALFMVHWGQSFEELSVVLLLLFCFFLFLFQGGGKFSLDHYINQRQRFS